MSEKHPRPRAFADHDVVAWRSLIRHGRVKQKDIATAHGVGLTAVKAMLVGQTYGDMPGALTSFEIEYPAFFDPEKVVSYRDRFRRGKISLASIRRTSRVGTARATATTVRMMLTGKTYGDLPGALTAYEMQCRARPLMPEVVLFMRLQYNPPRVHSGTIAKHYGLDDRSIGHVIDGTTYTDVPGAVGTIRGMASARFTFDECLELRRRFRREQPHLTQSALAEEIGMDPKNLHKLLVGVSYPHVPEAITNAEIRAAFRRFDPEVALFMRLQYKPGVVSCVALARAYGTDPETAYQIVRGKTYREVPCAVTEIAAPGLPRKLSDEEVLRARRQYASRQVTLRVLALELDITEKRLRQIVRGYAYKELPLAVPDHVRSIRGNPLGPKRYRRIYRPAVQTSPTFLMAAE